MPFPGDGTVKPAGQANASRMSHYEWVIRLRRSRQVLNAWRHEAKLPWADRHMTITIAETEIGVLQDLISRMPADMGAEARPLVREWDELRLTLLEA